MKAYIMAAPKRKVFPQAYREGKKAVGTDSKSMGSKNT